MTINYEDFDGDITNLVEDYQLNNKDKNMNTHSAKMYFGLAVVFLMGASAAYKGGFSVVNVVDMIVSGLLAFEHAYNGQTATM